MSSVYGFIDTGYRIALIPTLRRDGLRRQVSIIAGSPSTLRDTRLAVRHCEFDRDAVLMPLRRPRRLFLDTGLRGFERRSFLFLPSRLSDVGAVAWVLAEVRFGAQYLMADLKVSGLAQ